MGEDRLGPAAPVPQPAVHWSGLDRRARLLAWRLLAAVFVIDVVIQLATALQTGRVGLAGNDNVLGLWDLAKAITVGTVLIYLSGRTESVPIGTLGVLFLLVGIEDQIAIHGAVGEAIANVLRFDAWIPGVGAYGARNLGEFAAMALFGVVAFWLIWAGRPPPSTALRRGRLIFTVLLIGLFFFAVVVDLATAAQRNVTTLLVEELGERGVLSLSVVYALSLAALEKA